MKRLICTLITVIMLLGSMQVSVLAQTNNNVRLMTDQLKEQPVTPIEPQDSKASANFYSPDYVGSLLELYGINDYGVDIDNDRLFDYLRVELLLNVLADGIYNIQGTLSIGNTQLSYVEEDLALNSGLQYVFLDFNGTDISSSNVNGPYMLHVAMYDGVYTENVLCRTKAYNYTEFEALQMPPILEPIGNKSVRENETLQFIVSANDANGDVITYSVENLPEGASFDSESGMFIWTPDYTQAGVYEMTFIASDGILTDSETIEIVVQDVQPGELLTELKEYIKGLGLDKYLEKILLAILDAAEKFLNKGNYDAVLVQLKSFIATIKAIIINNTDGQISNAITGINEKYSLYKGRFLTQKELDYLIKCAEDIIDAIKQIKGI